MRSLVCLLLLFLLTSGCATAPVRPRPDMTRWLDEDEMRSRMVQLVERAKFGSQYQTAVLEYAVAIRICYGEVSLGGTDRDAGRRAMERLRQLHDEVGGGKRLWEDARRRSVKQAGEEGSGSLPGMAPLY